MSDTLPQRPTFSNGQYIGADDLNATVDYARDRTERLALSGRTWGIGTGLALVEIVDAAGATQMYIEPGVAWDGYSRAIVVISPAAVTADLFAGLPSGNQKVWLKYSTLDTQMISPGFQTCGAGDPATRIAETYAIVTTATTVVEQNDGVVLNGVTVADPRNMLIAFDAAAAVVLDGSAPHQLFPDDSAEWLVPIGIVSYNSATGTFNPRTPAQLALDRIARRYIGTVAESVLAADGVLRLRDRQTDQNGQTNDSLELAASIQTTDIQADPNNPTRLIGNELVWVEGNMRVLGDARLWAGELSLRAGDGSEPTGSMFLRRNADATNPTTVQNLEVSIGQQPSGTAVNRLLVAASNPATASTPATLVTPPALSVGADARVGIGVAVPGAGLALDVNGDFGHDSGPTTLHLNGSAIAGQSDGSLLLTASSGMIELGADGALTHVVIGTKSPQADTALDVHGGGIAVNNQNAFLRLLGSAFIDQDDGILRIRSGGSTVAFDGGDNVGINTQSPAHWLDVNGDANVATTLTAGSLSTTTANVSGNAGVGGNLNVGGSSTIGGSLSLGGGVSVTNIGSAFVQLLGSRISDNNDGILHIESGGNTVAFDGFDNVGIGTTSPSALLHVAGAAIVNAGLTVWGPFSNPSDARLKKDIRPLEGALERLLALRGVEFEWEREDLARLRPGRHAGLIADQVEKVFPGWVHDDPSSGMKLLGAQGFEALAVEALRELAQRIEALEQENRRLARLVGELRGEEPQPAAAAPSAKGRAKRKSAREGRGKDSPPRGESSGG
jgi:Chaperone of endosialidase